MKFDKYCHKCISDMLGHPASSEEYYDYYAGYYCLYIDMKQIKDLTEIPKNCPYRLEKLLNQF